MVRHLSAKEIYGGSIPPAASRSIMLKCSGGVIGSRTSLKMMRPQGHAGSSPAPSTIRELIGFLEAKMLDARSAAKAA